jgi:glutamate synthase domain-containing protein 3
MTATQQAAARAVVHVRAGERDVRTVNREIRAAVAAGHEVVVDEPLSRHNLGVALTGSGRVVFHGSVGYYCAGLSDGPEVVVERNAGWAIGEALASGRITVRGDAGMSVGASMRGGLIHVGGNTGPRCGIALKGGDIVVEGDLGYSAGFMAHAGRIICLGSAADAAGDSLWGGSVWVAGRIRGLGVDAQVVEPPADEVAEVEALLGTLGLTDPSRVWKQVVSAGKLWHFQSRDASQWLMI